MRCFRKILSGVLILSLLCLYFPQIGLAGQNRLLAKANTATTITEHKPEILTLPEEKIPLEAAAEPKTKKWVWYVLAGVTVVGLIAAAGGGGGGGKDVPPPPPGTGTIVISAPPP
ncbi:MAG: hypothetical protein JSU83_01960 [Deltaproteobacteria bacterium]|nr:MAG: hypothetical protein JSU83_01960 [Deltaproteobacteria bacterium]